MTNSELALRRRQAQVIARRLKAAERGEPVPAGERLAQVRRDRPAVKFAVVLEGRLITIEIAWAAIAAASDDELSEMILREMRRERSH